MFVAKYDTNGALVWARNTVGPNTINNDQGFAIAVDSSGNSWVTGVTGTPGNDVFLAKYDSTGALMWTTIMGGVGPEQGFGIAVDGSGNIYVTGVDSDTPGVTNGTNFVAKFKPNGTPVVWSPTPPTLGTGTGGFGIALDSSGNNIDVTGHRSDNIFVAKFAVIDNIDGTSTATLKWLKGQPGSAAAE
jgi:hypothetical protein